MKKLLNTLFVMTQGSYLAKEGESLLVRVEGETKGRFPVHNLAGVICFGNVLCSPFLLGHCVKNDIEVSMLTENGRFLCRVTGPVSGNVLLRREQYRWADNPEKSAEVARAVLIAKIANCRTVLQRSLRDRPDAGGNEALQNACKRLADALQRLRSDETLDLDSLRGIEGDSGHAYFANFANLITSTDDAFSFHERTRRPPTDPVNALLSFLYTILAHDVRGALESVGLDPAVGFLHRDRPGRPSLALDMMEELRPVVADRLALSLINRAQLKPQNFQIQTGGAVVLDEKGRKIVLRAYQERKQEEIRHPFLDEKIKFGLIPYTQALLLARFIRGDLDGYPPYIWR